MDRAHAASAAEASRARIEEDLGAGESVSERVGRVFAGYQCGTMTRGVEHPGDVAEAASLSSVSLPKNDYPLHETVSDALVATGALSRLQLEGVAYACQKHLERLPDGYRAGFMIGDGAGVGKGRQISGIILDNFARGRRRHVWISSSRDLRRDAQRDLRDLGCHLRVIDGVKELERETRATGLSKTCSEGVLFLTYSTLVSKGGKATGGSGTSRSKRPGGKTRVEQVVEWFIGGEEEDAGPTTRDARSGVDQRASASGCLIFDECHKAKNYSSGASASSRGTDRGTGTASEQETTGGGSKVAACVVELQRVLPNARVVYCSATGISEIGNMAYLTRMGFWGIGTPFVDSDRFIDAMKHKGVGFLEMLAMEMKSAGKYVSRGLSFRDAEFCSVRCALTRKQAIAYDSVSEFMVKLKACLSQALVETGSETGGRVWKAYWSMHQRLFKLLCVSAKVPEVVRRAKLALRRGECVVIGMQTTGESAETYETNADAIANARTPSSFSSRASSGAVGSFISTTRSMLRSFVENHFPIFVADVAAGHEADSRVRCVDETGKRRDGGGGAAAARDDDDEDDDDDDDVPPVDDPRARRGTPRGAPRLPPRLHADCVEAKNILLDLIDALDLPPNPLDELIDELGGPTQVAEMTGRRTRVVRRKVGNQTVLCRESRVDVAGTCDASENENLDGVNVREKTRFQKGEKWIAVVSDAASTGISLHARKGEANDKRRVHITIELPWSADKAIQQLGRTHRSNQTSGPSYVMVSTDLGGEKRFAAAVARRLQSLGALTRGDRRAATGIDLSEGNLDSPLGRRALKKMYDALVLRGNGGQGLANGIALEAVLAYLPRSETDDDDDDAAAAASAASVEFDSLIQAPPDASAYIFAEASNPGSGVSALHDELRDAVLSLGVQVGLGYAGRGAGAGAGAKDRNDVRRFLNRILGLPVRAQNLLFGYFAETLEAEVRAAKADGTYSEGVSDLSGSNITIEDTEVLVRDPFGSGSELRRTAVLIDRGVSFESALKNLKRRRENHGARRRDGFYRMRRDMYGRPQIILATTKPGAKNTFTVTRPNTGSSYFETDVDALDQKYFFLDFERQGEAAAAARAEARAAWDLTYGLTETKCMHGSSCPDGSSCRIGTRLVRCCIVSGAVVPAWGVLEKVLERHAEKFHKSDRGMRAVRVVAEDGTKVVGIRYPEELLGEVREKIIQEWGVREDRGLRSAVKSDEGSTAGTGPKASETAAASGRSSPSGRSRKESVTPVDPRCARRATTAPKTMRSFFRAKDLSIHPHLTEVSVEGSPEPETKRRREDSENPEKPEKPSIFAGWKSSAPPLRGASAHQRQTCPICQHVFPASSLNTDINAHVDGCVENTGCAVK